MLTEEGVESASSSSTTYYESSLSMNREIDGRIASLLSSLRLTSLRINVPQDGEDEFLKKIHRQLEWLVNEEPDNHRRRRLRHILPAANCVREQLFVLRRYSHNPTIASGKNYAAHIHAALTAIMKESFEEDYRKLAIVVGVLDAVAELLIFEVNVFGIDCPIENRTIRKLIASTLTNLTFGNAHSKRRLCSHPNLIEYTIKIIDDSRGLSQVYAGLLRNLSWMADAQMSATLAPSVPALVRASLRAYHTAETKCLCATLSALWNLASHSRDNKKALCEEPNFLEMLVELSTNDARYTTLVEPATGVLKYASMYMAVVGSDHYLSPSAVHMMMFRLMGLLNSPSFTVIGNVLGVLSQLLAKDLQLRSHIVVNQKAMVLLNHLRNSTRDDIRNPVKTVLNYLNSSDVSGTYASASTQPHSHGGMSSSYTGTATIVPFYSDSSRLLKYRSSHSHTASALAGNMNNALKTEFFPYSSCGSSVQQGFAPRPGDRSHHQEQFASLPRHFFQKTKISNTASNGNDDKYFEQSKVAAQLSSSIQSLCFSDTVTTALYPIRQEQVTNSNNSRDINTENAQNLSLEDNGNREELRCLDRPDDPSFEVEDSVRCTRCTSTQSLSSLLPGEKSTWDSCNNSAAESNRLSPLSATEIPDSPTHCALVRNSTTLSARNLDLTASTEDQVNSEASPSKKKQHQVSKSDPVLTVPNVQKSSDGDGSSNTGDGKTEDDYGSFLGRADSELLNQSIEDAMPKRVEINEEFLADMIEQAQPKPSPVKHYNSAGGRNFIKTTAYFYTKVGFILAGSDDFLLQSIASVLPQNSSSWNSPSGVGSPPKKSKAMANDTVRTSSGPKRTSNAVFSSMHNRLIHSCSAIQTKELRPNNINLKSKFESKTSDSPISFDAALENSFIDGPGTSEKTESALLLIHQYSSDNDKETMMLNEDNYSPLTDNICAVDKNIPQDVDEDFHAEQLIIDCSVVSDTVKQTCVRPFQKEK
ncbi:unnamed protein product [Thelazia callipaeda]|uniref:GBD/FH3 domain-containing protein n=1 Tax=Thelazia callipaeda TaxID=103827 RepID=A0A0N5CW10_THECL|nr:unnamed protein product [Thelazia callipaeda]